MSIFNLHILTPEGTVYNSEVERVTVRTADGEITILKKHTPLVSLLVPGELRAVKEDHDVSLAVTGGVLEVRDTGEVIILADRADKAADIDREAAERARARAEEILEQRENLSDREYAELESTIEKEIARIKVVDKYSRK